MASRIGGAVGKRELSVPYQNAYRKRNYTFALGVGYSPDVEVIVAPRGAADDGAVLYYEDGVEV